MDANTGGNYAGTTIFLSYIAAALVLVFRQTWNIYTAYNAPKLSQERRRKAGTFAGLALVSFGILSFNMLHELLQSYSEYSKRSGSQISMSDTHLWSWMTHSNLFEEFVDALAGSPVTWWWTQLALLVTMHICIWLAQNYNANGRKGLMELVLISQILPISFTLNLGYTHVLLDPKTGTKETSRSHRFSGIPLLAVVGAYLAALSYAPAQSEKGSLIPLVFLIRLLMIVPSLLTPAVSTTSVHAVLVVLALGMQAQATSNAFAAGCGWIDILKALHTHPAVTTLGYDVIIAIFSSVVYRCSI